MILVLFIMCLTLSITYQDAYSQTMRVITKENAIRDACRFFAPVKVPVKYGDALEVLSTEGDWYRVRFRGLVGCIHRGALEGKAVSTSLEGLSGQRRTATEQEVALAGKGFNPEVERAFKARHPEMNFALVDTIERYRVDEKRVAEFMRLGGLREP